MDEELVRMLKHKVLWEKFSSRDGAGRSTYLPPEELPCFLDGGVKMLRGVLGEEMTSNMTILLNGTAKEASITVEDRFTLPDGSKVKPLVVNKVYNEYGNLDHVEVYV